MQKKDIIQFVKECDKGICNAKCAIKKLDRDSATELKAALEGHKIHFDKWITMFVPFVSMVIAELALIGDMKGANQDELALLGFAFLIIVIVVMGIHAYRQVQKAKWIVAAQYLEEYSDLVKNEYAEGDGLVE